MEIVNKQYISFRVTPAEYGAIQLNMKATTSRNLSEFARRVLLNKPVVVRYRNESADHFLTEMIQLRKELHAIGNNFNQAVKRLHTLDTIHEIQTWLLINDPLKDSITSQTKRIEEKLQQNYDLWLSK